MISYSMRTENSCGPDAMGWVCKQFGASQAKVDEAWGIDNIEKFKNIADTPFNHAYALFRLGLPRQIVTCGQILKKEATPERTIVLIHLIRKIPEGKPWAKYLVDRIQQMVQSALSQHWVVYMGNWNECIYLAMGNGKEPARFSIPEFELLYSGGRWVGPQCAYEIGRGKTKISWAEWAWGKMTGKFV